MLGFGGFLPDQLRAAVGELAKLLSLQMTGAEGTRQV